MISLSVGGGPTTPDAIPSNPADPADQWRYNFEVTPAMVDSKLAWCDDTIAELITALEATTTGW